MLYSKAVKRIKIQIVVFNRFVESDQNPIKASREKERSREKHETLINRTNYLQQFYIYWILII